MYHSSIWTDAKDLSSNGKSDANSKSKQKPLQSIPVTCICDNQEEYANFIFGLYERWPEKKSKTRRETLNNWLMTMAKGKLQFPKIIEDTTQPTCIRIPLGIIKAILILLNAQIGYRLEVSHYDKGQATVATVVVDSRPKSELITTLFDAMNLTVYDLTFLATVRQKWRLFFLAVVVFARRGIRRLTTRHLETIMSTSLITQIEKKGLRSEEFMEIVNSLPLLADNFSTGVYASFEMCLILARDFCNIAGSHVQEFFPPGFDPPSYFSCTTASKIHLIDIEDLMEKDSTYYNYWLRMKHYFRSLQPLLIRQEK